MNNDNSHINYTAQDIEKYFLGRLSSQEMHAMERAALDDPFLAEAMEGYEAMKGENWKAQLTFAQKQIAEASSQVKIVPLHNKRNNWWRTAAAVLLVGGGATLTFLVTQNKTEEKNGPQIAKAVDKTTPVVRDAGRNSASSQEQQITLTPSHPASGSRTAGEPAVTDLSSVSQNDAANKPSKAVADSAQLQVAITGNKSNEGSVLPQAIASAQPKSETRSAIPAPEATKQKDSKEDPDTREEADLAKRRAAAVTAKNEKTANRFFNAQVVAPDNTPLPFSNISVKSGNFETYADVKGNFRLFSSTDSLLTVEVRSIGYEPRTFSLRSNQAMNKIILLENEQSIKDKGYNQNSDAASAHRVKRASVLSDTAINVEPKDGWDNYNTYVANNLDISEEMVKAELHGEVELSFDVKPNGTISNVRINKSLGPAYDEAARRLIMQGPQWKVKKGKKTSANVKVKF